MQPISCSSEDSSAGVSSARHFRALRATRTGRNRRISFEKLQASRRVDAIVHARATKQGQRLEQTGTDGFASDCHSCCVNEGSRFHTARVGKTPKRSFGRYGIEVGEHSERRVERGEMIARSWTAQIFLDCIRVVLDRVTQKQAPLLDKLAEMLRARL